ncbi:hypothetical protein [Lutimonas vermicola]|uniref:Apea-like HEPN domain-containing protein n=1 Tax=Lutimonas vermicola TaxID=414288 RepID=A0ABU9L5Z1_9FLAO
MTKNKNSNKKEKDNDYNIAKDNKNSVEKILKTFKENLHGVRFYFNKFGVLAEGEDDDAQKSAEEFSRDFFEILDNIEEPIKNTKSDQSDEKPIKISDDKIKKLVEMMRKRPKLSVQNFEILSSSSFLMLNNYFEYLIADLLTYHYTKFKNTLNSKEFKISLKEIDEYDSIADLEKHLIFREVETMLIEMPFDSLLKHFEKKLNISLSNEIVDWKIINECRERRHIIVHNASKVNKKYILRTNNPDGKKIGDKIIVDRKYFESVFSEIRLAGLLLSYECWGNWDNNKTLKAIKSMLDESFDSLSQNEIMFCYKLSQYIGKIEPRNDEQEDALLRAKFNMCISLKMQNKTTELNKVLKTIKVGTCTPLFKLAHAILSNKNDSIIIEFAEDSLKLEEIDFEDYKSWPLFQFTRSEKVLNEQMEQIFNPE